MKLSLHAQAELELVEGASYYTREANRELGEAFIAEFDRPAKLLADYPGLGATWRGRIRRFPLRRFPYSVLRGIRKSASSPSRTSGAGPASGRAGHERHAAAVSQVVRRGRPGASARFAHAPPGRRSTPTLDITI